MQHLGNLAVRPCSVVAGLAFALLSTTAHAQGAASHAPPDIDLAELWEFLDRDGDGRVGRYEGAEAFLLLSREADADADGAVSEDEVASFFERERAEDAEERQELFAQFDSNGDERLVPIEVPDEFREVLLRADANGDGSITWDEFLEVREPQPEDMFTGEVLAFLAEVDQDGDDAFALTDLPPGEREEFRAQFEELDVDADELVTRDELLELVRSELRGAEFVVRESVAEMNGVIGPSTPGRVLELILEHPEVETLYMLEVPGSMDDESMLRAARLVRERGWATHLPPGGEVASGGTDFFLAGVERSAASDARFGVHSWAGMDEEGADLPRDDPEHAKYLEYYTAMGIQDDFYWFTLEAAPADDIHWMTGPELERFGMLTSPIEPSEGESEDEPVDPEVSAIFDVFDRNRDGELHRDELPADARQDFDAADTDGNGIVTPRELASALHDSDSRREVYPPGDPYGLEAIDVSRGERGIVPLPSNVEPVLRETFDRYARVVAPNGRPIHLLAQPEWTDDQIVHCRKVLEHFLTDAPGTEHGADKSAVANAMAERRATMVLFATPEAMEEALGGELGELELGMQDLRANECPAPGSRDYMQHATRDAAYEEVLHLVHDYGIRPAAQAFDRGTQENNLRAAAEGLWDPWPEDEPDSHRNEYIAAIYDNYLDLWTVTPTLYESHPIGADDVPEGTSHFGHYRAGSRARLRQLDRQGFELVESFFPPAITYTAELAEDFEGTFSIAFDPAERYTAKAQHLRHVMLRGDRPSGLSGNDHANRLTGNAADNVLQGLGGDDQLTGGAGTDTAVFRGPRSEYEIRTEGDRTIVSDSVAGRDGTDVLASVEQLRFADSDSEPR